MFNRIVSLRTVSMVILAVLVVAAWAIRGDRTADTKAYHKHTYPPLSSLHMKSKAQLYQPNGDITPAFEETWYLAPDKARFDLIQNKNKTTNILRGNLQIIYANDSQAAVYSPTFSKAKSYVDQNTPSAILESLRNKGRIDGKKTVAGRKCDSVVSTTVDGSQVSCCIDKKTGITIAYSEKQNNKLAIRSLATIFEPNSIIKKSVFNPKLPKGMPVVRVPFQSEVSMMLIYPMPRETSNIDWGIPTVDIKHLRDQSKVSDDLHKILKDDHKIELKELYEPTYIPSRFWLLKAIGNSKARKTRKGWSVSTSYDVKTFDRIEINYIDPKTGDALILIEDANPPKSDSAAVSVKGFDGKVAVKTDPFPYTYLTWSKNGVFFKLGAVNENKDALIKVAESMKMMQ